MSEITSDSLNRDLIKQLNAEIDRLKAENDSLVEQFRAIREICYQKDALITELCDALEKIRVAQSGLHYGEGSLIHRARDATRQEK